MAESARQNREPVPDLPTERLTFERARTLTDPVPGNGPFLQQRRDSDGNDDDGSRPGG